MKLAWGREVVWLAVWLAAATLVAGEAAAEPAAEADAKADAKAEAKPDPDAVYPAPCYPETIYHTQYIPKVQQVRVERSYYTEVRVGHEKSEV